MKKNISIIVFSFLLFSFGCEDFLEEKPKSFAAPENYFDSEKGIAQVINGVYNASRDLYRGRVYVMNFGLTTDEITLYTTNTSRKELESHTFTANNGNLNGCWQANVYGINRANIVIESIPENILEKPFGRRAIAEAKFLRAWYYFSQVRTYGSVPLLDKYEGAEFFPTNAPVADIYELIVSDLKDAEQGLPGWKEIAVTEKGRASKGAAKSLLAWVYLTRATSDAKQNDDMANAAAKAKEVIDSEGYGLWDKYIDAFHPNNENGKEDIFSYQFQAGTFNNNSIHADFSPNPDIFGQNGFGNFGLTPDLYSKFESGDERLESILFGDYKVIGKTTVYNTKGKIFTQKYADYINQNRNDHSTNLPFIRYSNVLLMYAEAANELSSSPTTEAYSALNQVRERVNLPALSGLTKEQFRQQVRDERYKEFHGEGIRWFDLTRWGILKERVELVKTGVTVSMPKHKYFPIPQEEIDANPNLKQNEGY